MFRHRLICLVPFLLLGGCLEQDRGSRGKLSDAVEKSRDGSTDHTVGRREDPNRVSLYYQLEDPAKQAAADRQREDARRAQLQADEAAQRAISQPPGTAPVPAADHAVAGSSAQPNTAPLQNPDDPDSGALGITAYVLGIDNRDIRSVIGAGPTFKFHHPASDSSFDLYITGETYEMKTGSAFANGVKDVVGICGGLNGRHYTNGYKVFFSPFIGVGEMFWQYRNELTDSDGGKISSDAIGFFHGEAFVGVDVWRKPGFHISSQIGGFSGSLSIRPAQALRMICSMTSPV